MNEWDLIIENARQSTNAGVVSATLYAADTGADVDATDAGVPNPSWSQVGEEFEAVVYEKTESSEDRAQQDAARATHKVVLPPEVEVEQQNEIRDAEGEEVLYVVESVQVYDSAPSLAEVVKQ